MKRSEMKKLLLNGLCDLGQWYDKPPEQVAQALCILLQPKEGWDPEEEPLPEKLVWYGGRMAEDVGMDPAKSLFRYVALPALGANQDQSNRNVKILKAALEAYNEIGPLRRKLERAIAHIKGGECLVVEVLAILEEKA